MVGDGSSRVGDELLSACLLVHRQALLQVAQQLLHLVRDRVELIASIDLLAAPPVLARMRLGETDHLLDLALIQVRALGDRHALLRAGRLVPGRDVEDAVGIDVERDFDLGNAARRGRDSLEPEARELAVVGGQLPFAL